MPHLYTAMGLVVGSCTIVDIDHNGASDKLINWYLVELFAISYKMRWRIDMGTAMRRKTKFRQLKAIFFHAREDRASHWWIAGIDGRLIVEHMG